MNQVNDIVILCGGQSRRMGHDKAELLLPNKVTLLEHLCHEAHEAGAKVHVSGMKQNDARFKLAKYIEQAWPDIPIGNESFNGPLAGLLTALKSLQRPLLLIAVDMPLLQRHFLKGLLTNSQDILAEKLAVILHDGEKSQPCCSFYSPELIASLEVYLKSGRRSMQGFIEEESLPYFTVSEKERALLENINTPEDWQHLSLKWSI